MPCRKLFSTFGGLYTNNSLSRHLENRGSRENILGGAADPHPSQFQLRKHSDSWKTLRSGKKTHYLTGRAICQGIRSAVPARMVLTCPLPSSRMVQNSFILKHLATCTPASEFLYCRTLSNLHWGGKTAENRFSPNAHPLLGGFSC